MAQEKKTTDKKEVIGDPEMGKLMPDSYFNFVTDVFKCLGRFVVALWRVFYIIPCLIMGILHGLICGLESGLINTLDMYQKNLKGDKNGSKTVR
jgi:hypothetical protein